MSAWTAARLADRRRDLAARDVRAGTPLQRAAAYLLAQQQTPTLVRWWSWARSVLVDGVRPGEVRQALADAVVEPGGRPDAAALLRLAAAGRAESAARCVGGSAREAEVRDEFEAEAATLEAAARVAAGDLGPLYNWVPSWRWTQEMLDRIDEDFATEGGSTTPEVR